MMAGPYLDYGQLFLKTLESTDGIFGLKTPFSSFTGRKPLPFCK